MKQKLFKLLYIFNILFCISILSLYSYENPSIEQKLLEQGLVDIQSIDPSIQVDLKYSSKDNFLGEDVYGDLNNCYLQKEVAVKLMNAQKYLRQIRPGYSLLIYDGVRPRRIQYRMWDIVKDTDKQKYVANPKTGSIHNYGCAVDLTIVDENGRVLDMGTPFDYFDDLAQPRYEKKFLKEGKLTEAQIKNRELLREVMQKAGFEGILSEWWHFNGYAKEYVKKHYKIIE
ncbi:MAG: M15 family metallopeptidase [Spirochaetes bacterium]|nr:M15 family metallopeptidase [Spirochaetota bacterium]